MKRADLSVGMIVEDKGGRKYVVVDTGEWRKFDGYRFDATGVTFGGLPVWSGARRTGGHPQTGVLVAAKNDLAALTTDDGPTVGGRLLAAAKLPRNLYPEGHNMALIKERRAAFEAEVDEQTARDKELVEIVQHYWGDVPHLIATAGVILDDGLLTERERQVLVTLVLAGQNR